MIYLKIGYRPAGAAERRGRVWSRPPARRAFRTPASLPSVTISFALKPGISLGQATDEIRRRRQSRSARHHHRHLPGHRQSLPGFDEEHGLLLIVAIAVVYIVLGVLYESYVHPLTILSGLPSAGFGALLTLMIFKVDLSIYSFVGLIMLIGIVKKNAIMQIDFALEAERKEGKSPAEAIYEGCLIRFRPIMMTTMAALLGALPIALGYGAGGEARKPLGSGGGRRPGILAVDDPYLTPWSIPTWPPSSSSGTAMEGAQDARAKVCSRPPMQAGD